MKKFIIIVLFFIVLFTWRISGIIPFANEYHSDVSTAIMMLFFSVVFYKPTKIELNYWIMGGLYILFFGMVYLCLQITLLEFIIYYLISLIIATVIYFKKPNLIFVDYQLFAFLSVQIIHKGILESLW